MFVKQYFIALSIFTPEATKPEIPSRLIRNFPWNIGTLKPIKKFYSRRSYRGDAKFLRTSNSPTVTRTRIPQRNPLDIRTRYRQYLKAVYPIESVETSSAVLLCKSRGKRKDGKSKEKKRKESFRFFFFSPSLASNHRPRISPKFLLPPKFALSINFQRPRHLQRESNGGRRSWIAGTSGKRKLKMRKIVTTRCYVLFLELGMRMTW